MNNFSDAQIDNGRSLMLDGEANYYNIVPIIAAAGTWAYKNREAIATAAKKVLSFLGVSGNTTLADLTGQFDKQIDALPQDQKSATAKNVSTEMLKISESQTKFVGGGMYGDLVKKIKNVVEQFAAYAHIRVLKELLIDNNITLFNSEFELIKTISDNYSGAKAYFSSPASQIIINELKSKSATAAAKSATAAKSTAVPSKYKNFRA